MRQECLDWTCYYEVVPLYPTQWTSGCKWFLDVGFHTCCLLRIHLSYLLMLHMTSATHLLPGKSTTHKCIHDILHSWCIVISTEQHVFSWSISALQQQRPSFTLPRLSLLLDSSLAAQHFNMKSCIHNSVESVVSRCLQILIQKADGRIWSGLAWQTDTNSNKLSITTRNAPATADLAIPDFLKVWPHVS